MTFELPEESDSLRTYAELMTMFDNPKFPDQLSALGGDPANYKLPWDKAAANPRSYFGITRVVLHDGAETPRPELTHLRPVFAGAGRVVPGGRGRPLHRHGGSGGSSLCRRQGDRRRRPLAGGPAPPRPARQQRPPDAASWRASPRSIVRPKRELALPRIVPGLADCGPGFEQPVFVRGDCMRPGETVPRRYLEVLSRSGRAFHAAGSGRLELAERIAAQTTRSPHG